MAKQRTEAQRAILIWLWNLRRCQPRIPGYYYRGPGDFLLKNGKWYELASELPAGVQLFSPRRCFGNAIMTAALHGLRYVEGYAVPNNCGIIIPVHHAWNLDATGRVVDTTWRDRGLTYFGVEFCVERADDATWNGDGTILDDPHRRWPILKERWQGEPPDARWYPTPALQLLQKRDLEGALVWTEANKDTWS